MKYKLKCSLEFKKLHWKFENGYVYVKLGLIDLLLN